MRVKLFRSLRPDKGRDQHDQCGLGQVKIGHQCVSNIKFKSGVNENIGRALPRCNLTRVACRSFHQPQRCCAHRDHTTTCGFCGQDFCGSLRCDFAPFFVHFMGCDIINFDGQKCACPHMQRDISNINALGDQRIQQPFIKMKRGCWRSPCSAMFCKTGLIVFFILIICCAFGRNLAGQRHGARLFQCAVKCSPG